MYPSFTSDWSQSVSNGICVASNGGSYSTSLTNDSGTATVDGVTYTTPFSTCPGESGEGGGDTSAGTGLISVGYYAGIVAAFVGML